MIRIRSGKDNHLGFRDDRSFDIHDDRGKIGHLTGYLGGPWSDAEKDTEFRVTHVEISEPGRRLSPGEWKEVLHGLRESLPAEAELIGGNRGGEGGDLHPAYEKLFRLPDAEPKPELTAADLGAMHEAAVARDAANDRLHGNSQEMGQALMEAEGIAKHERTVDPLERARQRAREAVKDKGRDRGPEI